MKENLTGLAKLARDEAVYAYNWSVGKVVGLIALSVTYLVVLWGCIWVGYGTLNMVMWAFVLIFSIMYWKGIGGIAALGEFFYQKDKPEKQSVWRLYLMLFMSAIFAGYAAIVLRMIGAPTAFPQVVLMMLLCVATSLYLAGSQLDKYLPWMTATVVILALVGLVPQMNQHYLKRMGFTVGSMSTSEIAANDLGDKDVTIQDERRARQLRWVEKLMECKLPEDARKAWVAEQGTAYKSLCEANGNITLEEVGKHWPNARRVWDESQAGGKKLKAGGAASAASSLESEYSILGLSLGGLVVGHIIWILLFGGAGLGWYVFKKKGSSTETKTVAKTASTSGISGGTIILILALAGGGYYAWNDPTVRGWLGLDGSDVTTNAVVPPSMTELNRTDFTAHYDDTNPHIRLPQDPWNAKDTSITQDCSITLSGGVHCMLAFGEGNRLLDLYLAGECAKGGSRVPYVCEGKWRTTGHEGYFRGVWNTQGTVFSVTLCNEDWKKKNCNSVATVVFINKPKDNR